MRVYFHQVAALHEGAPFVVAGRTIGKVESIALAPRADVASRRRWRRGHRRDRRARAARLDPTGDVFVASKGMFADSVSRARSRAASHRRPSASTTAPSSSAATRRASTACCSAPGTTCRTFRPSRRHPPRARRAADSRHLAAVASRSGLGERSRTWPRSRRSSSSSPASATRSRRFAPPGSAATPASHAWPWCSIAPAA